MSYSSECVRDLLHEARVNGRALLEDVHRVGLLHQCYSNLKCCLRLHHQKFTEEAKLGNQYQRIRQFVDRPDLRRPSYTPQYFEPGEYILLQSQEFLC